MLHKLALVHKLDADTIEKLALISPEQDAAIKKRLHEKMLAMAEARGATVPLSKEYKYTDPYGGVAKSPKKMQAPAYEKMRFGTPHPTKSKGGLLGEKAIQEAYGTVSKNPLKQIRHRTIGKGKRFLAGAGGLGGKFRNRAAALGGLALLGGLGAGVKSYLDAPKDTQVSPEATKLPTTPERMYQHNVPINFSRNYNYYPMQSRYAAAGYDDVAKTPAPPKPPKVSTPGPAVGNIKLDTSLGASSPNFATQKPSSKSSKSTNPFSKKASEDNGSALLGGLIGGTAGGVGGFLAGDKIVKPILSDVIEQKEKQLLRLKNLRKIAPIGGATAGALLLAAVVAALSKNKTPTRNNYTLPNGTEQTSVPNYSGFNANDLVNIRNTQGIY